MLTACSAALDEVRSEMKGQRLIGIALLVLGLILLYFGYQSSQGIDDQVSEALTSEYT